MEFIKRLPRQREFMIFIIIVAIFVAMTFASPVFLTRSNVITVLLAMSVNILIGVGMANLMVSGGFDMSVGSVSAFSGAIAAFLMTIYHVPVVIAVLAALICGAMVGMFNGFIIAKVGINPFVTTLAGLSLFRGLTLIITQGRNISSLPAGFNAIGQTVFLGVQTPIWIALFFIVLGELLLRKSRFFRQNYYIGGNEKAARLSGIPVDRMKIINYMITGFLAALGGIVVTARLATASTTAGTGLELQVITAVIIGGASLQGGEGTVLGAVFGALLMVLINNAMNLLNVDVYWQTFVTGAVLLIAVLIDRMGKLRRERIVKAA